MSRLASRSQRPVDTAALARHGDAVHFVGTTVTVHRERGNRMGLLDKATKLAAAAREQLETARGQLDDVHARREASSVRPAASEPLDDHEKQVVRRAIANGAPDPATLLSSAQASAAIGHELGGPNLTYADRSIGVAYEASGGADQYWRVEANSWHGDEDGFDAAGFFRDAVAGVVTGDPVEGVGERALFDGQRLYVLAPPHLIHVETRTPDGTSVEQATVVARCVLENLAASMRPST
jgi:hypothetical protein